MSNGATAVLLSPIAISLAEQMGIDPRLLLLTVMFAASTCYLYTIRLLDQYHDSMAPATISSRIL